MHVSGPRKSVYMHRIPLARRKTANNPTSLRGLLQVHLLVLIRDTFLILFLIRAVTQQLYYDIMFDKHDFSGVIQRFGNIHSQPGEYSLDSMLIAAPNMALHIMPLPIVSHQRNRYVVFNKRGIKHLKQTRVYFQCTPSC